MIEFSERCAKSEEISKVIQKNTMIGYLTAFARARSVSLVFARFVAIRLSLCFVFFFDRRNEQNDRDIALATLRNLRETQQIQSALSNDIICLCGRIFKDKYIESDYQDQDALNKAIEFYQNGFAASPNL
jgi:hypothetical protein